MAPLIRTDLLPVDLKTVTPAVIVKTQFNSIISTAQQIGSLSTAATGPSSQTPGTTKDVYDFFDFVVAAQADWVARNKLGSDGNFVLTQESPDINQTLPVVTFKLIRREPGAFSEGSPFEGSVKNLRPILRANIPDVDNPGYRKAILGYWYDNEVRFTCWSRTNKEANRLSIVFEQFMEDYTWYYRYNGVQRVVFYNRGEDEVLDSTSSQLSTTNKYYGRPINYFVKTERLRTVSEKELEQLIISVTTSATLPVPI